MRDDVEVVGMGGELLDADNMVALINALFGGGGLDDDDLPGLLLVVVADAVIDAAVLLSLVLAVNLYPLPLLT